MYVENINWIYLKIVFLCFKKELCIGIVSIPLKHNPLNVSQNKLENIFRKICRKNKLNISKSSIPIFKEVVLYWDIFNSFET